MLCIVLTCFSRVQPQPPLGHASTPPWPRLNPTLATPQPHLGYASTPPWPCLNPTLAMPQPHLGHASTPPWPRLNPTLATPQPHLGHASTPPWQYKICSVQYVQPCCKQDVTTIHNHSNRCSLRSTNMYVRMYVCA